MKAKLAKLRTQLQEPDKVIRPRPARPRPPRPAPPGPALNALPSHCWPLSPRCRVEEVAATASRLQNTAMGGWR